MWQVHGEYPTIVEVCNIFKVGRPLKSVCAVLSKLSLYGIMIVNDICHYFVRERVFREEIKVVYCVRDSMVADIMTKGLSKSSFEKLSRSWHSEY